MSAADKVALVNTVNGANADTSAAICADRIIYNGKVVLYLYSTDRAGFFAFHTSDTAVCAYLAGNCALIVIGAFNHYASGIFDKRDNALWALAYADSAADAFSGVYNGNAVFNLYCILRTNRGAITVSKTSVRAGLVAFIGKMG